jgi:hypothetical protein
VKIRLFCDWFLSFWLRRTPGWWRRSSLDIWDRVGCYNERVQDPLVSPRTTAGRPLQCSSRSTSLKGMCTSLWCSCGNSVWSLQRNHGSALSARTHCALEWRECPLRWSQRSHWCPSHEVKCGHDDHGSRCSKSLPEFLKAGFFLLQCAYHCSSLHVSARTQRPRKVCRERYRYESESPTASISSPGSSFILSN